MVTKAAFHSLKRWSLVAGVAVGLLVVADLAVDRRDIRTRQVRYKGELCTEYFDAKDGVELRAECPSRGGEWYVDTDRVIHYAPSFPVKHATKPSNDR